MVAAGSGPDGRLTAGFHRDPHAYLVRDHPRQMPGTSRGRTARVRTGTLALAVTGAGLLAAALMAVADFLPIVSVDVANGSCEVINASDPDLSDACMQTGLERHGPALMLLALVAGIMAWGAGLGGARPAAAGLAAVGAAVLAIALLVDLPVTDDTGAIGPRFEGAQAQPELGFAVELLAGVMAVAAGATPLLSVARD